VPVTKPAGQRWRCGVLNNFPDRNAGGMSDLPAVVGYRISPWVLTLIRTVPQLLALKASEVTHLGLAPVDLRSRADPGASHDAIGSRPRSSNYVESNDGMLEFWALLELHSASAGAEKCS
jgi:hypothetical protein